MLFIKYIFAFFSINIKFIFIDLYFVLVSVIIIYYKTYHLLFNEKRYSLLKIDSFFFFFYKDLPKRLRILIRFLILVKIERVLTFLRIEN